MPNIRVVLPGNTVLGVCLVRSKCVRVTIILYTLLGDCRELENTIVITRVRE